MYADPLVIFLVLMLGGVSFFFGIFYVLYRMVAGVGRGMARMLGIERRPELPHAFRARREGPLICPRRECRKVEHRHARYCSQCGTSLAAAADRACA